MKMVDVFSYFTVKWFGVFAWLWILMVSTVMMICLLLFLDLKAWFFYQWNKWRNPEKLLKVVIHYKSGLYKIFWRLIPHDGKIIVNDLIYRYYDKTTLKDPEIFGYASKEEDIKFKISGKEYNFSQSFGIRTKDMKFPEIHYYDNIPKPIDFISNFEKLDMTSEQTRDFEDNQLWSKLLNIESEKMLIIMCIVIGIINLLLSGFMALIMTGVIKMKG